MKRLLTFLTATAVMILMFASAAPAVVHLCSDHPNQQSAQAALNQDPSLAPTLDPDGDGVACEDFFGAMATPTVTATASRQPKMMKHTVTATASRQPKMMKHSVPPATALAASGGPPLVVPLTLVASLALVGSGVAALALVRRGAS